MDVKDMIRINLDNPHYIIDDVEITSSVLDQMSSIVKYIMTEEALSFDEAFIRFHQSELFSEIEDIKNKVWSDDVSELINTYYCYENIKSK